MQIFFIACRYIIYLACPGNKKKSMSFRITNKYIQKYRIGNSKFVIRKPGTHIRIGNTKFLNAHALHRRVCLYKSTINLMENAKRGFIDTVPIIISNLLT